MIFVKFYDCWSAVWYKQTQRLPHCSKNTYCPVKVCSVLTDKCAATVHRETKLNPLTVMIIILELRLGHQCSSDINNCHTSCPTPHLNIHKLQENLFMLFSISNNIYNSLIVTRTYISDERRFLLQY